MAPIGEIYFPPLDRCLSGEHQLLSWRTTYVALSQLDNGRDTASLKRFLTDPQTIEILGRAFSPVRAPTAQTKSTFETKTSAVNVAPSSQAHYNISEIKEDTLWLSKEAKTDEVSALRTVVLEWQTRSAVQLLRGDLEEQYTYLDSEGDTGTFRASVYDPGSSRLAKSAIGTRETPPSFGERSSRHRRLLEICLIEKRCLLKCSEFITFVTLFRNDEASGVVGSQNAGNSSWLREVGSTILSSWNVDDSSPADHKHPIADAVGALGLRIEGLTKGSGWLQGEGVQEDIEVAWARSQVLEMIHIMQIILNLLESSSVLVTPSEILAWFRLMKNCDFYDSIHLFDPTIHAIFGIALMSLPALISLAILNLPLALDLLEQSSTTAVRTETAGNRIPYILDSAVVSEINDILIGAAQLKPASPAVMAWAIIMNSLRETALETRESREARQSLRAADRYGAADSSDNDGVEPLYPSKSFSSLRRRSSTGSDTSQQSTLLEDIYDNVSTAIVDGDYVAYLASHATGSGSVFQIIITIAIDFSTPFGFEHNGKPGQYMRGVLLDLIRASADYVDYAPLLLTAALAVLTGSERYWDTVDRQTETDKEEPAAIFLQDRVLIHKLYFVAMLHFPHESLPFLELCRALAFANDGRDQAKPAMWTILEDIDNFTCSLPSKEYQGYVPTRIQEEANFIELTEDLVVAIAPDAGFPSVHQSITAARLVTKTGQSSSTHQIPSGTSGKLMNETKPFVVAWNQSYSPLAYMGKVLHSASTAAELDDSSSYFISSEIVSEIIGLITNMLSAATRTPSGDRCSIDAVESAVVILGAVSEGVGRNQDAISVVFDIFEKALYKPKRTSEDIESMELLVQCVHFTFSLLQVMPDRVWPFLGRSGLLGIGRDDSQLRYVVATQEMVMGRYNFLIGCVRLFDSLVNDAVSNAVSRKTLTKALTRFGAGKVSVAGVSQSTIERVVLSFTRTMIEVFESTMKWKFVAQADRMEINARLASTFRRLLSIQFDIGNLPKVSQNLVSELRPAADYVVDVFLPKSSTDVNVLPLLHILGEGMSTPFTTLPSRGMQYWTAQVTSALKLSSCLICVNGLLQRSPSHLEHHLFKATRTLAKLYVAHESYKLPVVEVFDSLVRSAAENSAQPPSLLGYLGPEASSHFLDVLSCFDQPLANDELSSAIWRLLSAVVSKRQQWFAVFILTGETPRASFKDKANSLETKSHQSEPMLNTALEALSNIDRIESGRALSMLEFVALAGDFWPWVLGTIEKHGNFLTGISKYAAQVGSMAAASREKSHKPSADYNSIQMASLVADILSMYTHYTQQMGNQKFAKALVPHLTYLIKNAILTPSYNASLHGNLRKNFELKFPNCSLGDYKRTNIRKPALGESFFYDLELAGELLSYDPSWVGKKRGDGFAEEFRRANLNLSVVESQVNLFNSWKSLLIELSDPLITEPKFQRIMAVAVTDCLMINADNNLPEAIFKRLAQSRANLAFTLLQRLLDAKSAQPEVLRILPIAWDTVRRNNSNVGSALDGDDADYYRTLLKILYLALQAHASSDTSPDLNASQNESSSKSTAPNSTANIALEILSTIVAQGFRSLTVILHDDPALVRPTDFALLTAILRSALLLTDVARNTTHLLNAFSDSQTARCASTLLSWSDQLATSGDPLYGELSILFLLEMSSVPALAESLAVEGVLSHILSTNLVRVLQSRPFGPFTQPVRMYTIWARGMLPLLLNLLHSVGPPLAAEIAATLNTFPHQLEKASSAFMSTSRTSSNDPNRDQITLSIASEAVTLSLITTILQTFRNAGSSVGIVSNAVEEIKWDRIQVKEEVEACLQRRGVLRERIVATNEREEIWCRAKPQDETLGAQNKLEEKVVDELRSIVGILDGNGE